MINYQSIIIAKGKKSQKTSGRMPIITRETKSVLPEKLALEAKEERISILKPTAKQLPVLYQNYPNGSILFPKNPNIATKFNVMVNNIKQDPNLIEFFRKIHINSLNQLYSYLMKIYTNFNLINPGFVQEKEDPAANEKAYLIDEATYATNKKKLIINHFINIIQAQFSASIISYSPATPPDMAATLGKIFISNDYGIDLTPFAMVQTDQKIIVEQVPFINFLQQYIEFFQAYTNLLSKTNPTTGTNQYFTNAQSIKNLLEPAQSAAHPLIMDPNMFFYDIESMRSIQFIPFVAETIPKKSQLIPWAPIVVDSAIKHASINGHPVAIFTDIMNKKTIDKNTAEHLYMFVETGPSLFKQELLAQPGWLNTKDGCVRILRACLGDFSALVGMGILDDETEIIIQKALPGSTQINSIPSATIKS